MESPREIAGVISMVSPREIAGGLRVRAKSQTDPLFLSFTFVPVLFSLNESGGVGAACKREAKGGSQGACTERQRET